MPIDFRTRFPALDGVRALAVAMVFAAHYGGGSHGGRVLQILNIVRERGWIGVDLFFALSGFLITGILYDTQSDPKFFRRFYARRSLRIFPVYYLTAAVLLLLTPIFHYDWKWRHLSFLVYLGNFFGNADGWLYDLTSANHPAGTVLIGHLWSLCVEEQFYLLWPVVVFLVKDRVRLVQTALVISAAALLLRVGMVLRLSPELAEWWVVRTLPFRLDALLLGGVLALLLRGPAAAAWQRRSKWVLLATSVLLLAIFRLSPAYDSPWTLTIGLTLTALVGTGLTGTLLQPGVAARVFSLRPMRALGRVSYGFYVFHMLFVHAWTKLLFVVIDRLHSAAMGGVLVLLLNFATTFVVATLSYDLVERRFLRWKRHFDYDAETTSHRHAFRP